MRGKIGLVVGLGIGYVLGTRAGRARYEQIKQQAQKVWELEPVQKQVDKAKDLAANSAMAVPRAAWAGVVKIVKVVSDSQSTPSEKAEASRKVADETADDIKKAAS
ncbi:hypothetical protein [Microbacterium amylolyticum]|uniref:YtxH domain-containing protein n=1 Tax=Microbacterium amylolyticum TaxID=936337 RepID=A0ABS4ZHD5_9MICO|nr:hypothetical protein [Microbacterium amylolyticum]MBP2436692.1 hypothetical protein [Microbacterium amylolyticum]